MPDMKLSCSFTGHRPHRFSFGYDEDADQCVALKKVLCTEIKKLIHAGVTHYFTGMALGVDQWAALAVLSLKQQYPGIQMHAVLPCETQADKWTPEQRSRYFEVILPKADSETLLQRHFTPDCMFKRNRYLVDHAEYLLAVYDGSEHGGTASTIQYAKKNAHKIIVIDPNTLYVRYLGSASDPKGRQFRIIKGGRPSNSEGLWP